MRFINPFHSWYCTIECKRTAFYAPVYNYILRQITFNIGCSVSLSFNEQQYIWSLIVSKRGISSHAHCASFIVNYRATYVIM